MYFPEIFLIEQDMDRTNFDLVGKCKQFFFVHKSQICCLYLKLFKRRL